MDYQLVIPKPLQAAVKIDRTTTTTISIICWKQLTISHSCTYTAAKRQSQKIAKKKLKHGDAGKIPEPREPNESGTIQLHNRI